MNVKQAVEWWKNNAIEIFEQAVLAEFYGEYLFEKKVGQYYQFQPNEPGIAVWLIPDNSPEGFKATQFEGDIKVHRVIPRVYPFYHCECIDRSFLEDGQIQRIEDKLKEGAKNLAKRINQGYVNVLLQAAPNPEVYSQDTDLDEFIAEVNDKLAERGFHADRFLYPKRYDGRLRIRQSIISDDEIQNSHYAGKTKTGLLAFWSDELPDDMAFIFDSSVCITLTDEERKRFFEDPNPGVFSRGICGTLDLNVIIRNTEAVIAIKGIEQAFTRRADSKMQSKINLSPLAEEIVSFLFHNYPQDAVSINKIQEAVGCEKDDCQSALLELIDQRLAKDWLNSQTTRRIAMVIITREGRNAVRSNFVRQLGGPTIMENNKYEINIGDGNVIQSSNFVVAEKIENSLNKVESANVSEELRTLLKDLAVAVNEMSEELPPEEAEQVARDLEVLTAEATSEKPRKKWWQLSVDGLVQAAKNVGKVGVAVIVNAKKIAELLQSLPTA